MLLFHLPKAPNSKSPPSTVSFSNLATPSGALMNPVAIWRAFCSRARMGNSPHQLSQKIYFIRGQQVMLDSDLAELYAVETKTFNRALKRNLERFPEDFMFQLTNQELAI